MTTIYDLFVSLEATTLGTGYQFTEGPVWHPDGYLLFSDIPAAIIYRYEPGAPPAPWRRDSGNANGLTFDRQGRLLACEHGNRRVSRTAADGTVTALAERYEGRRLNSPNDVVVRSDGTVFFTDPPYGIKPEEQEQPCNGVYSVSPAGELRLQVADFGRPNGLALSPDERTLYVDDSPRRLIRAFDVAPDGALSNGRLFADMSSEADGSPDGMKFDVHGRIYCTGPGGIWLYEPDGALIGLVRLPQQPANLTFGGPDLRTLYITARTGLYSLPVQSPGLPVF
jgi:gluconolactonase